MHSDYGANGLHLYPQASYWDWPYTADNVTPRLLQIERDWIWYKAWGRYAWNSERNIANENLYWAAQLSGYYNCNNEGEAILQAYQEAGEIAPKLLRRFGISDGNRQTLLLGMFMSQLVNPYKWRIYQSFYESNGPEGEILLEYAEKEWKGEAHTGETPPQIIEEALEHANKAKKAILKAEPMVSENIEEFQRLKNDILCYDAFANFFANKVKAAMYILNYKYSGKITDLEKALPLLEKSIEDYTRLVGLTENSYLYANSMQTRQRRVPIGGDDGGNKTWKELLPLYAREAENLKNNIEKLKTNRKALDIQKNDYLRPVQVEVMNNGILKPLKAGQKIYQDKDYKIKFITNELTKLHYIPLNFDNQINNGTSVQFRSDVPVKVVVGYFNGHSHKILQPPSLETNAHANDQGQADIRIANALDMDGLYPVNVYTYYFDKGEHTLKLDKGIALILGFMDGTQEIATHNAGNGQNDGTPIDWLFY